MSNKCVPSGAGMTNLRLVNLSSRRDALERMDEPQRAVGVEITRRCQSSYFRRGTIMPLNLQRFLAPALALLIFSLGQGQTRNLERAGLIQQPPVELTRLLDHINLLRVDSQRQPKDASLKVRLAEAEIKSGQL